MRRVHAVIGVAAVLAVTMFGARAWAIDLTGVWSGEQHCDRFDGHKFSTPFPNDVMVISQQGTTANMAALFDGTSFNLLYEGRVIDDAKDPTRKGQAGFTECVTAPGSPYQETLRATKLEVKGKGDAEFEGISIFLQISEESRTDTGTCKWNYKRVSTEDPGVLSCSALPPSSVLGASPPRRP